MIGYGDLTVIELEKAFKKRDKSLGIIHNDNNIIKKEDNENNSFIFCGIKLVDNTCSTHTIDNGFIEYNEFKYDSPRYTREEIRQLFIKIGIIPTSTGSTDRDPDITTFMFKCTYDQYNKFIIEPCVNKNNITCLNSYDDDDDDNNNNDDSDVIKTIFNKRIMI